MADASDVTISLTSDEALVLFDLLHRWEDADSVTAPEHQAEQVALWSLSALLEREDCVSLLTLGTETWLRRPEADWHRATNDRSSARPRGPALRPR
jgi:hypothetical protein